MNNKEKMKQIAADWFPSHEIDLHVSDVDGKTGVEILRWKKKDTWAYFVEYIARKNTLMVRGDIGEAVYCWSSPISLEWVAGLDLQYFHGKCQASEWGRMTQCYEWDKEKAKKRIFEHFKDERSCKKYHDFLEAIDDDYSKESLDAFCHTGDAYGILGDAWWEWFAGCGGEIPWRIAGHLVGLKMAFGKGP